ncbi:MAG: 3,4-dehydroadipyl-CoA semialdehyde dehydrogenase [Planctomycetota bacterium]|nr:3,4-dehydroadipyl-CoA semialdehyde dehydrogenase [Planctomycetota bacterium]
MAKQLESYVEGRWVQGSGEGTPIINPTTEEMIAETSTAGIDFEAALQHARQGGAALRQMTFAERGTLLGDLAKAIHEYRAELLQLSTDSGGNTRSDAKFDIDGATGTMAFYGALGKKLGDRRVLADGDMEQLTRAPRYVGQHVYVPRRGAAVHINAFNFPAWGMGEKLAVSTLAGMPAVIKPATSTLPVAIRMVEIMVDSGLLPAGMLTLISGSCGNLVDLLGEQDVLAFTGSADTGNLLRGKPNIVENSVRVNVEADSLNSAVLGPDVDGDSETFGLFLREVVRDMTQKAGQKCTAIRRIFVPDAMRDIVVEALGDQLGGMKVGDPNLREVRIGPVATAAQLEDVTAGIDQLAACAKIVHGDGGRGEVVGVEGDKGFFVAPTLLVASQPAAATAVHNREVFGPVATVMGYGSDVDEACALVAQGRGSLVSSIYSDDRVFVEAAVLGMAPYHGRLTVGDARVAEHSPGPGTVLPSMVHGGPGRAGGGEELGGVRGLGFYSQRTAVQGLKPLLEKILF